jgi:hypothetical protein
VAFDYTERMSRPTTLERAFELTQMGNYAGIGEIRDALRTEGYTLSQLDGQSLLNQHRELCAEARKTKDARPR